MNVKVANDGRYLPAAVVSRELSGQRITAAKIINISLEMGPSAELENAVDYAWNKGAVIMRPPATAGGISQYIRGLYELPSQWQEPPRTMNCATV